MESVFAFALLLGSIALSPQSSEKPVQQTTAGSEAESASTNQIPSASLPPVAKPRPTPAPPQVSDANDGHKESDTRIYKVDVVSQPPTGEPLFGWYLGATVIGVAVNALVLLAILKQTKINWRQVRINIRAARAARNSARAALLNAQAIISAERAWIVLELIEYYEANKQMFKSVITNYGRSPAQIIGYNIQHSYTMTVADLPPDPVPYTHTAVAQPFLVPEAESEIQSFAINPPNPFPQHVSPQPCLYWGVIRYRDSIGNLERETWFCLRYDARRHTFMMVGPPSYNRYT